MNSKKYKEEPTHQQEKKKKRWSLQHLRFLGDHIFLMECVHLTPAFINWRSGPSLSNKGCFHVCHTLPPAMFLSGSSMLFPTLRLLQNNLPWLMCKREFFYPFWNRQCSFIIQERCRASKSVRKTGSLSVDWDRDAIVECWHFNFTMCWGSMVGTSLQST